MDEKEPRPELEKIVSLSQREWLERGELADRLDVSPRTLTAMIQRGEVERRDTARGPLFRCTEEVAAALITPTPSADSATAPARTALVTVDFHDWTAAREALARLEARLDASSQDVNRAVEYARELEEECDRLAAEANQIRQNSGTLRAELEQERGRRLELEEQYRFVLSELESLGGLRARYHVERGRREEAEERAAALSEQLATTERQLADLQRTLKEHQARALKADFGPISLEINKKG